MHFRAHIRFDGSVVMTIDINSLTSDQHAIIAPNANHEIDGDVIVTYEFENWNDFSNCMNEIVNIHNQ